MTRLNSAFVLLTACVLSISCGTDSTGGTGGGSANGGGAANGGGSASGGGSAQGTPVTVTATTTTVAIPSGGTAACSGSTLGAKADLNAINTPVFQGSTNVQSLTLRYEMSSYFGEPTRKAVISWTGSGAMSSLQWLAEVQDMQGRQYLATGGQRVFASYNVGSIKGPGEGFGTDSTGSPSWSQTFVTFDNAAGVANGISDTDAKNIYRACFKLANVRVVKLNGQAALQP